MIMLSSSKGYHNCLSIDNNDIKAAWLSFCTEQGYEDTNWHIKPLTAMTLAITAYLAGNITVTNLMLSRLYSIWGDIVIDVENRIYYDLDYDNYDDDDDSPCAVAHKID